MQLPAGSRLFRLLEYRCTGVSPYTALSPDYNCTIITLEVQSACPCTTYITAKSSMHHAPSSYSAGNFKVGAKTPPTLSKSDDASSCQPTSQTLRSNTHVALHPPPPIILYITGAALALALALVRSPAAVAWIPHTLTLQKRPGHATGGCKHKERRRSEMAGADEAAFETVSVGGGCWQCLPLERQIAPAP